MLCATLKQSSLLSILDANECADLIEFRLDLFANLSNLAHLRSRCTRPVIFTTKSITPQILALKPNYIDLPHTASPKEFASIPSHIKRICSFHDFEKTPHDLNAIYQKMRLLPAEFYKIATTAHNTLDALTLLAFIRKTQIIGVAMGEAGSISRILAPAMGSPWSYAPLSTSHKTAPGQILLQKLKGIYHVHKLTPKSKLFGLIGDPITTSISHRTHNQLFEKLNIDAVYVKMGVKKHELSSFLPLAQEVGFQGLSVTMPHKETILPRPTNTLKLGNKLTGINTDGLGALAALEKKISVKNKQIAILGAGGSAKAIAIEAKKRGAHITIYNRTPKDDTAPLQTLNHATYDILINTIPCPIDIEPRPNTTVMDIVVSPHKTPLLIAAEKKGCVVIEGIEMFINQAVEQFMWWFHEA